MRDGPTTLRRLLVLGSCCTRRPVVTISSPIEDREDEEGCEAISTQDSIICQYLELKIPNKTHRRCATLEERQIVPYCHEFSETCSGNRTRV